MSDHLELLDLHDKTVHDVIWYMAGQGIPMTAYVSTDREGENILYFEWNDHE